MSSGRSSTATGGAAVKTTRSFARTLRDGVRTSLPATVTSPSSMRRVSCERDHGSPFFASHASRRSPCSSDLTVNS
jgi:hypothetical protein